MDTYTIGRTLLTRDRLDVETSTWQHSKETFMPPPGFEPSIPARQLPQTYVLQRAVIGIGFIIFESRNCLLW
jgi:hypothetical protein